MKNVKQLRDLKAQKFEEMEALNKAASAESRSLTAEESTKFNKLAEELRGFDTEIEQAETFEKRAAEHAAAGSGIVHGNKAKEEVRDYSITRAIQGFVNGNLSGLELEMHQEAQKEAREYGQQIKNLGIPMLVLGGMKRDNSVTMPTQPEDGSVLVAKEVRPMIEMLRSALIVEQLGATVLRGLKGDISFPTQTSGAVATWKAEVAELDKSNLKFGDVELAPKRLGTYAIVSKQLIAQSTPDVERIIRQDLMNAVAEAVNIAAINGSGLAGQPLGILNTPNIGAVALGTDGGVITYEALVMLEAEVAANNALRGDLGYLTTPKAMAKMKVSKVDAGSGIFLVQNNEVNGYPIMASNLVPSNLTKGLGTGLSAVIFGNWNDLLIGQWGGLDVLADPYTLATLGQIRLIVDSFWDVAVRRPKSFAAIKDAITTPGV